METQTRFDLNNALEDWRRELAAQPNLATEARRELETHLRDSMAELRQRGLNDEESFWLVRHRVGEPSRLAEEFVKSDPAKAWRERTMWIAIGLFAYNLWQSISGILTQTIFWSIAAISRSDLVPEWVRFHLRSWFSKSPGSQLPSYLLYVVVDFLPVIWIGIYVAGGRIGKFHMLKSLLQSRGRFLLFALALVFLSSCVQFIYILYDRQMRMAGFPVLLFLLLGRLPLQLGLTAAIVWLMPPKSIRPAVARAI